MITTQNQILTESQIRQIIKRIAFEIYENNFYEDEIVLVGIYDKGYLLAELLLEELNSIAKKGDIKLVRLNINKNKPLAEEVKIDCPYEALDGKVIVLVDDVLNSGRTVIHSIKALLQTYLKKVEIVALVDRSHKQFPIVANYKGYELSTTIDEHVDVRLDKDFGVYLY